MKTVLLFPLTLFAFSCASTKPGTKQNDMTSYKVENQCPQNVDCTFEILQNKSLSVKTDEIGQSYYQLEENSQKVVFKYQYKLITDKDLADAGYVEEVLFEMDKNYTDFSLSGKTMQNANTILNVMCFCRGGKAGAHKLSEGSIIKKGKQLSISIPKTVDGQKITEVKITL